MRLNHLSISQFKSIRALRLDSFHTLDIFIGKNNSGKSNILDAAMLFLHQEKYPPALFDVEHAHIQAEFGLTADEVAKNGFSPRSATLRCELLPGQIQQFSLQGESLKPSQARSLLQNHIVHMNTTRLLMEYRRAISTQIRVGDISIFFAESAFAELAQQYPQAYKSFLRSLHSMFPHLSFQPDKHIFLRIRSLKQLYDTEIEPHILEGKEMRTIANLGSGYMQVFVMLLFLYHPGYSVVIIDEPENHLHIGLQKKLFKIMLQAAKTKHILISTHSPLFVTPESFVSLHRVLKDDDMETRVFPTADSRNRIDIQRLSQELNLESNEMLFADHVILVEGEADEILLKGLVDRFYTDDKEILVFAVHSNTNFKIYQQMLHYFHIPYSILTDRDSLYANIEVIEEVAARRSGMNEIKRIETLRQHAIHVLPYGALERHYPRKYQNRERSKPLNALVAAKNITYEEFSSPRMRTIFELLQSI